MRSAVVLAGSRGIGFACGKALVESGHSVTLFARSEGHLADASAALANPNVSTVAGHIESKEALDDLFGRVERQHGGVDVLVANTPGPPPGDILSLEDEAWRSALESHALPVFRAVRRVVPRMRERRFGRIILIASVSVKEPLDNLDLSNFLRPGLAGVARTLARKLAIDGVTVHLVCPGSILTERSRERIQARANAQNSTFDHALRQSEQAIPMGRLGTAGEIAALVAFLASDAAGYMTGNVIQVDGGLTRGLF